jgi:peroxiredoxin
VVTVDRNVAHNLVDAKIPSIRLPSSRGGDADLNELCTEGIVAGYVYPMTGVPGVPVPPEWDSIPGARGCTPQSCAFRDAIDEFSGYGVTVIGVSSQASDEQSEFAMRERIPYMLLSDNAFQLEHLLGLPTFWAGGRQYYRRLTFVAKDCVIVKVFYPVLAPERNATDVLDWLKSQVGQDGNEARRRP